MAISIIQDKIITYKSDRKVAAHIERPIESQPIKPVINPKASILQDIYGEEKYTPKKIKAVEVKVDRKYNVSSVDAENIKSDVVTGPVKNKVDKLRSLRRGN